MEEAYVLMTITAPETEPRVRATGTEEEVKARAFKILDRAISHNGTIKNMNSEYGYWYHITYELLVEGRQTQVEQDLFIQRHVD